ncbi:MAG: hypothetical protein R3F55_06520 [Alphaproteobacteria bacterium]
MRSSAATTAASAAAAAPACFAILAGGRSIVAAGAGQRHLRRRPVGDRGRPRAILLTGAPGHGARCGDVAGAFRRLARGIQGGVAVGFIAGRGRLAGRPRRRRRLCAGIGDLGAGLARLARPQRLQDRGQRALRVGIVLAGRQPVPHRRPGQARRHALAMFEHAADPELRPRIALVGQRPEQVHRPRVVAGVVGGDRIVDVGQRRAGGRGAQGHDQGGSGNRAQQVRLHAHGFAPVGRASEGRSLTKA